MHHIERNGSIEKNSRVEGQVEDSVQKHPSGSKWGANPFDETPIPTLAKYTINIADQGDLKVQTFDEGDEYESRHEATQDSKHNQFRDDMHHLASLAEEDLQFLRQSLAPSGIRGQPHTPAQNQDNYSPADEVWYTKAYLDKDEGNRQDHSAEQR